MWTAAFTQPGPKGLPYTTQERKLILVRHAKSAYPKGVEDFRRPLGPRGILDAPVVGGWLDLLTCPQAQVIVSAATRTRQTWAIASKHFAHQGDVRFEDRVYEAEADDLRKVIAEVPTNVKELIIIGHSPGLETLGLGLSQDVGDAGIRDKVTQKFVTGGILVLTTALSWSQLSWGHARLLAYHVARDGTKPIT